MSPSQDRTSESLLAGRYRKAEEIGRGGQGKTYLGEDTRTGQTVAIKELSFATAEDWKSIELFQREGQALKALEHEAIPSYFDAFVEGSEGTEAPRFFLVREFVKGETFQELIRAGEVIAATDAIAFVDQVLDILDYLHAQNPPVIHRDIKPSNLILRPDGTVALIDFGAVQVAGSHTLMSTVVGTSGYVAPEQLAGRTRPASDLYSLGATVVHLLSHVHPSDLPMERMRLVFEGRLGKIPPRLMEFLTCCLEPAVEDRLATVEEAREVLAGQTTRLPALRQPRQILKRPMGSRIQIRKNGSQLSLVIPPPTRHRVWFAIAMMTALGTLIWLLPIVEWGVLPWLAAAFAGLFLVGQMFISPTQLTLDADHFTLNRNTVNGKRRGWTEELLDIEERGPGEARFLFLPLPAHLVLMEGVYPYPFGFGMSSVERRWVQSVVRARLEHLHGPGRTN